MPIYHDPDRNFTAIICKRGKQRSRCACGRLSTKLCDFPLSHPSQVTHKRTCDAPICDGCATSVGPDLDYCPAHTARKDVA